jgi:asparagine synthase (glutamine-hydrolysing)
MLGVLSRVTDKRIKTYTIATGTPELPLVLSRRTASQFNTDHTELQLDAHSMAGNVSDLVWYLSAPTVHSILAYFCCREAHKQDVSSIFSGHMADSVFQAEWFARLVIPIERFLAPLRLIPETIRERMYVVSEKSLRKAAEKRRNRFERYRGLVYQYFRYKRGVSSQYGSGSHPDELVRLFSPEVDRSAWSPTSKIYRDFYRTCGSSRMDERIGYGIMRVGAGPSALINYESIAAAFGMQMQTPFMDQQIVEFSRRIPFHIRGKNNSEKHILRTLCSQFVSPECAFQQKASFVLPFDEWLRSDLWPIVEETLSRRTIERRGIFDYDRIAAMCAGYRNAASRLSWVDIWAFVILEIWFREHCDPRPEKLAYPSGDWIRDLIASPERGRE